MSNILIINGAKKFAHSNGQLNDTLTEVADGTLRDLGHDVRIVRADSDYDVKAEVQNFLWADVVIWQMPGWWMGAPWTVKKYIDDAIFEFYSLPSFSCLKKKRQKEAKSRPLACLISRQRPPLN